MPLIFKERLDGCSDLYAKIRHVAMAAGKLHSRAIDDQMKLKIEAMVLAEARKVMVGH